MSTLNLRRFMPVLALGVFLAAACGGQQTKTSTSVEATASAHQAQPASVEATQVLKNWPDATVTTVARQTTPVPTISARDPAPNTPTSQEIGPGKDRAQGYFFTVKQCDDLGPRWHDSSGNVQLAPNGGTIFRLTVEIDAAARDVLVHPAEFRLVGLRSDESTVETEQLSYLTGYTLAKQGIYSQLSVRRGDKKMFYVAFGVPKMARYALQTDNRNSSVFDFAFCKPTQI